MEWPGGRVPDGVEVPVFIATAHFYLSPQYPAHCPTFVIPGSHRAGHRPGKYAVGWDGRSAQPVLCGAGDVLFFRSDLWHSGSNNATADRTRDMLQVHYSRRGMAPDFSPFLKWEYNPEVLNACNRTQRRLLGDHPPGAYD